MKTLFPTLLAASLITTGFGLSPLAMASDDEHHGHHSDRHHDDHHDGHHGRHYDGHHDGHHHGHHGPKWKQDLTDEQRKKYEKLRKDYKEKKVALKEKKRDAKTAFAKAIATDKPSQKAIDKAIDKIVKLKREKLKLKADYKVNVRKLLNKEQRKQFDEYMLNKAKYCRKGKGHHH